MERECLKLFVQIESIVDKGLDVVGTNDVIKLLGGNKIDHGLLSELRLYNETLPMAQVHPYSDHQRFLHFIWDAFDKLPMCLVVSFSIPFRRMMAERMFKKCGKGVIFEENVRFNFPQLIELGDSVFFNRNVFLDSKGGMEFGDFAGIAEDVRMFTHGHSESDHLERTYRKITIGEYVKVYSDVTVLPGVTMGPESIAASGAMVNKDVPDRMVVAGVPAKIIRERATKGHHDVDLGHVWLF